MKQLKCLTVCLPFLVSLHIYTPTRAISPQNERQQYWLLHARLTTDEIVQEAIALPGVDRSIIFGRLAALWWRADQKQSRAWLKKAIDELEVEPESKQETERLKRIVAARILLSIAAPLDEKSTSRLTSLLTSSNLASANNENGISTAMVQAAIAVVESDPGRAAQLGSASLRLGRSRWFPSLVARLITRNKELGTRLIDEAISSLARDPDPELIGSLVAIAFNSASSSSELRIRVVQAVSQQFVGTPHQRSSPNDGCLLARAVAPYLERFDQLNPSDAALIRAGLVRCHKGATASSDLAVNRALDNRSLSTVEDLLDVASKASGLKDRALFLSRAVYQAAQEGNFDRAVNILDSFTEEERQQSGDVWDNWRWDFALEAAIAALKRDDGYAFDKILEKTPARLRPFVQIAVAGEVSNYGDTAKASELLNAGRQGLLKTNSDNALDWYLSLLLWYGKLAPKELPEVFREFVARSNRTTPPTLLSESDTTNTTNDLLKPFRFPDELVEQDWVDTKSRTSTIQSSAIRIRTRLGFVNSFLSLARAQPSKKPKPSPR